MCVCVSLYLPDCMIVHLYIVGLSLSCILRSSFYLPVCVSVWCLSFSFVVCLFFIASIGDGRVTLKSRQNSGSICHHLPNDGIHRFARYVTIQGRQTQKTLLHPHTF